jgi:chaperonin GroES
MQVRPLHDRILVQRLDEGEQKRVALDVKKGDTILFGKYVGQEIKLDGIDYLIMKEDDVLAAIEGGGNGMY